jgi:ABC-type polysaccharide/polyol phosphate transport system ATPase subunit
MARRGPLLLRLAKAWPELGSFIDMRVQTYSSAMMVRLRFAVATSLRPEIVPMDEWLAAGDDAFLFVAGASIPVLASHAMPLLEEWCNRAVLLDQGRIVSSGGLKEIATIYQAQHA